MTLPAGWTTRSFAELGTWYGGGTPSKSNAAFWEKGDVPWLSPKDMGDEVLRSVQLQITRAAVEHSTVRLVPEKSVAVVVRSGILERTLPVALVPFETTLNQDMKAVVPTADIDARWVAWGLRAAEQDLLRSCRKTGTTVASIEMPRWYDQTMPVPPLREQLRILAVLEEHLSRVVEGARQLRRARRRLEVLAAASLQQLVSGCTDTVQLGDVTRASGYGTSTKCVHGGAGLPVVRIPNLIGGRVDLTDEKRAEDASVDLAGLMLKTGDLLLVRTNGSRSLIGRTAVVAEPVDASFASYLIRFQLHEDRMLPDWADLVMRLPQVRRELERRAASSAGQYNLGLSKLKTLELPSAGLDVQAQLVAAAREARGAEARVDAALVRAEAQAKRLRTAVMAAALDGRLRRSTSAGPIEEMADV